MDVGGRGRTWADGGGTTETDKADPVWGNINNMRVGSRRVEAGRGGSRGVEEGRGGGVIAGEMVQWKQGNGKREVT